MIGQTGSITRKRPLEIPFLRAFSCQFQGVCLFCDSGDVFFENLASEGFARCSAVYVGFAAMKNPVLTWVVEKSSIVSVCGILWNHHP